MKLYGNHGMHLADLALEYRDGEWVWRLESSWAPVRHYKTREGALRGFVRYCVPDNVEKPTDPNPPFSD